MASIKKKTVTRALPADAEIKTRKRKATTRELRRDSTRTMVSEKIATWRDRRGEKRTGVLVESADGSVRVRVRAETWTAKFRDAAGIVREVPTGCRDRSAAESFLHDLVDRQERIKANVLTPEQDRISDHQQTLVSDHIRDYLSFQRQQRRNSDHIQSYSTRLTESADGCGFRYLRDLSMDKLSRWLANERDSERQMSASVHNGFVESWVAFGNWLVGKRMNGKRANWNGEKRLIENPFHGMGKLDTELDRRRVARAMTELELNLLLETARKRPLEAAQTVRRGPNKGERIITVSSDRAAKLNRLGDERALIYKVACLTGLRKHEIRSMLVSDLSFGDVPFVKLRNAVEKNRKGSTIPLRSDLAVELRDWIQGKERTERVFTVPSSFLEIMNRDLEAAGIAKIDEDGRVVHVHALRHSFGTHLSMAGVAPRVAQAAMRHSNLSLTMNTYTDDKLLDKAAAIESLTILGGNSLVAPAVAPASDLEGQSESLTDNLGNTDELPNVDQDTKKPRESRGFDDAAERTRTSTGLTPTRPSTLRVCQLDTANNVQNDVGLELLHQLSKLDCEKVPESLAQLLLGTLSQTDLARMLDSVASGRTFSSNVLLPPVISP